MIYKAGSRLKDHSKKFNSVHVYNTFKWLLYSLPALDELVTRLVQILAYRVQPTYLHII